MLLRPQFRHASREKLGCDSLCNGHSSAAIYCCVIVCRLALGIVLIVGLSYSAPAQDRGSQPLPRVLFVLPSGVASETVQISYFMTGSFGGYGGFVRTETNRASYDIDASVDGKPATRVKVIAYLPGCEVVTLDIPLQHTTAERQLPCKPLGQISLHGQISPVAITQEEPAEVEVLYLAFWSHRFFGIFDGPVTTLRLGIVIPDENGHFEVDLPDFYSQTNMGDGGFQFLLRHRTTANIIAFLRPAEEDTGPHGLKVRSSYPPVVQFMAERQ